MDTGTLQAKAREAGALLKAMGNERRLLILCQLAGGEKSVGELEHAIDLSQSALSQHLARLRKDGLVRTRRKAQTIYYSIDSAAAAAVMKTLQDQLSVKREAAITFTQTATQTATQTPEETGTVSAGR
jgi:ArsR family transcriptional regulator, virulence genes transcriptional regulator